MAKVFLISLGVVFFFVYALPLTISPRRWARVFKWENERDLLDYFGRCTGVLALAIMALVARAIWTDPALHRELFDLLVLVGSGLTLVHVYGAIMRRQPWTEDAEIVLFLLATIGSYVFRP